MQFNDVSGMDKNNLRDLNLPRVSQIGIIVPDLVRGADCYGKLLNIKKWYRTRITHSECLYRDKPIDLTADIAVGYSGDMQIELIRYRCDEENIYSRHAAPGGFGYHHIGMAVGDLDRKIVKMRTMGIEPLQSGTICFGRGGVTKYAYFDTVERAGLILEFIETRAFGFYLGMPEWLVNIGRLTGDTEIMV